MSGNFNSVRETQMKASNHNYFKRALTAFTAFLVVLSVMPFNFMYADSLGGFYEKDSDNTVTYNLNDGVLTVSGKGAMTNYDDLGNSSPFCKMEDMRSIVIEDGVTCVGDYAFADCYNVETVVVADSVNYIGQNAFERCINLRDVVLPENLKALKRCTFKSCLNLEVINLPDGLVSIENQVFANCEKLSDISFPNTLEYIGGGALDTTKWYSDVPDGLIYIGHVLYKYKIGESGNTQIKIKDGTKSISDAAFYGCKNIVSIAIPDTVKDIGVRAFSLCRNLEELSVPNGVTEIKAETFSGCENLKIVRIPKTVTLIDSDAFKDSGIGTIFYDGDSVQWNSIKIKDASDSLKNAEIICSPQLQSCNHERTRTVKGKGAACTECGYTDGVFCDNCGKWLSGHKLTNPIGHTPVIDVGTDATCTLNGKTNGSHCKVCNEVIAAQKIIPALGHSFGDWFVQTEPSCNNTGSEKRVCARCGHSQSTEIPKLAHVFSGWKTDIEATCQSAGTEIRSCTLCGKVETRLTEKTEHVYGEFTSDNNATCCSDGTKSAVCIVCGTRDVVTDIGSKKEHIAKILPRREPTCTEPGLTEGAVCSICSSVIVKQKEIPPLGHSFGKYVSDNNATCQSDGTKTAVCTRCSAKDTVTYSGSKKKHDPKFISGRAPTCTESGLTDGLVCSVCNTVLTEQKELEPLGHSFGKYVSDNNATCLEDGTKTTACSRCGERKTVADKGSAKGHREENVPLLAATCTEEGHTEGVMCSVCGEFIVKPKVIAKKGHNFITAKAKPVSCFEDGYTEKIYCRDCGYVARESKIIKSPNGHRIVYDKAVAPTCTKSGKAKGSHCPVCGTVFQRQQTIKAKGHVNKNIATKATTSKDGKITSKCTVCGKITKTTTLYKVNSFKLSSSTVSYTGKAVKPAVVVKNSKGASLKNSTDYTVTYKNNTNIGTATAVITLKGNYSGTKTLSFKIVLGKVTGLKASQTTSAVTLTWSKVVGAEKYNVYSYNAKTKKYKKEAVVKSNKAVFSKLKPGTSYSYVVRAVRGNTMGAVSSMLITSTRPLSPKIKVSAGVGQAKISWNKISGVTGYVVYYSTSKNGKYTKLAVTKNTAYSAKKLKKGKPAYFKVAAYKNVGGKNIYSYFSETKGVKIK